jgi:hypothetical protein
MVNGMDFRWIFGSKDISPSSPRGGGRKEKAPSHSDGSVFNQTHRYRL